MKRHGGKLLAAVLGVAGGAAAAGAAVLAGVPGRQAVALLPGVISWGFFVRWCRRSFRSHTDAARGPLPR